jgi:hypothetical protein
VEQMARRIVTDIQNQAGDMRSKGAELGTFRTASGITRIHFTDLRLVWRVMAPPCLIRITGRM